MVAASFFASVRLLLKGNGIKRIDIGGGASGEWNRQQGVETADGPFTYELSPVAWLSPGEAYRIAAPTLASPVLEFTTHFREGWPCLDAIGRLAPAMQSRAQCRVVRFGADSGSRHYSPAVYAAAAALPVHTLRSCPPAFESLTVVTAFSSTITIALSSILHVVQNIYTGRVHHALNSYLIYFKRFINLSQIKETINFYFKTDYLSI